MSPPIASVVLDDALEKPLDYAIPPSCELEVGMRVAVPLRGRTAIGTVLALKEQSPFSQLKSLERIVSTSPLISPELFELALWISKYYCCPIGKILRTILPPALRKESKQHKTQKFLQPLVSRENLRKECKILREKYPAQAQILDTLLQNPKGLFLSEILEKTQCSQSPIKTLVKKKLLRETKVQMDRSLLFEADFFRTKPKQLTKEQQETFDAITSTLETFTPHLIHGVTGSGKTEIYLQAIQQVLEKKKSVIYLVPEISLTAQTIAGFRGRFGPEAIAV